MLHKYLFSFRDPQFNISGNNYVLQTNALVSHIQVRNIIITFVVYAVLLKTSIWFCLCLKFPVSHTFGRKPRIDRIFFFFLARMLKSDFPYSFQLLKCHILTQGLAQSLHTSVSCY